MGDLLTSSIWFQRTPDFARFSATSFQSSADIVVIGGGIVGALTAWHASRHHQSVLLLEKNHIATGDTGCTTGFLTRVPEASIDFLIKKYGHVFVVDFLRAARNAQRNFTNLIDTENIQCRYSACNSYIGSYTPKNKMLRNLMQQMALCNEDIQWREEEDTIAPFHEAIQIGMEGKFDARAFVLGLCEKMIATRRANICEATEVRHITWNSRHITLVTNHGIVKTKKVIVAMGNPTSLFPECTQLIKPILTYVIATKFAAPILNEHVFWDMDNPYFYFRRADKHTLLAGGCDIAPHRAQTQQPFALLQNFVRNHWDAPFTVSHQWAGSIYETTDRLPYIFSHPESDGRVIIATGFGGVGMVYGALAAEVAASLVQESHDDRVRLFDIQRTKSLIPPRKNIQRFSDEKKQFVAVGTVDDFGATSMRCARVGGIALALFKTDSGIHTIQNTCTHAGGSLCEGTLHGSVVQCPLHGAQFNVTTGAVVTPPAVRAIETFPTRIASDGKTIEVEISLATSSTLSPLQSQRSFIPFLLFTAITIFAWLLEFLYQTHNLHVQDLGTALARSFALTGTTLIGCSLFSSSIFKWRPKTARFWRLRRYLGVGGFVCIFFHALSVYYFYFVFDLRLIYFSWNPFLNPIIFGSFAFPIFMMMALTSTDWAVRKLGATVWKNIHRLVYIAYPSAIFHFLFINPSLLQNIAGRILLTITTLAVAGHLYWFFRIAAKKHFHSRGTLIGIFILIVIIMISVYKYQFSSQ